MRQVAACGVAQHDSHVRSAMRRLRAELAPSKACVYQTITRQAASRTTDVKCLQVSHHQAEATREISHTTRHSTRSDSRPGRYGILTVYETGTPGRTRWACMNSLINSHNTTLAPPSTAHTTVDMERRGARAGGVSAVAFIHAIYYTCA